VAGHQLTNSSSAVAEMTKLLASKQAVVKNSSDGPALAATKARETRPVSEAINTEVLRVVLRVAKRVRAIGCSRPKLGGEVYRIPRKYAAELEKGQQAVREQIDAARRAETNLYGSCERRSGLRSSRPGLRTKPR